MHSFDEIIEIFNHECDSDYCPCPSLEYTTEININDKKMTDIYLIDFIDLLNEYDFSKFNSLNKLNLMYEDKITKDTFKKLLNSGKINSVDEICLARTNLQTKDVFMDILNSPIFGWGDKFSRKIIVYVDKHIHDKFEKECNNIFKKTIFSKKRVILKKANLTFNWE